MIKSKVLQKIGKGLTKSRLTFTERLCSCRHIQMASKVDILSGSDKVQAKLMEENIILVNDNDRNIGSATKKECHLLENINKGMLHRAFSVFLFNTDGQLLLQQRSDAKITYPGHFTNTCCSHPLCTKKEIEELGQIGIKRAAQRRLNQELGIPVSQTPLEKFHYLTRILYRADNVPSDGLWGEHEIDYILFIKADVDVKLNENEVKSYRYINRTDLRDILEKAKKQEMLITPWFRMIVNNFLFDWWENLDRIESKFDHKTIHKMV